MKVMATRMLSSPYTKAVSVMSVGVPMVRLLAILLRSKPLTPVKSTVASAMSMKPEAAASPPDSVAGGSVMSKLTGMPFFTTPGKSYCSCT